MAGRGYDADLAYVHEAGFSAVAEAGARTLLELLRRKGVRDGFVVELGCGAGASSRLLVEAGYDVLGIDSSPAMIELAHARAPSATFRVGSWVDAELPPCEGVSAFGEVLNYLFDERVASGSLAGFFARVHEALVRGGIFVFDVVTRDADDRGWRMGDDWVTVYEAEEKDGTITRHITTFRAVDGSYRRSDEVHRLRLYPVSAIADSLREAGFRVRLRRGYGTVALSPNVRAFVATKPR